MSNELSIVEIKSLAVDFARSGMFPDIKSEQQAMVKIIAGNELGLPPFASMSGLHIISGKVVMGGNLIATLIKGDPRYDYRFAKDKDGNILHDNTQCVINFFEGGELVGVSSFTMQDAQAAKVWSKTKNAFVPLTESNPNWKSYPRNMMFNRAISNGAKWYCAGVFGGAPVYTPEEMGANVDGDGELIYDVTPRRQPARLVDHDTGEVMEGEIDESEQQTEPIQLRTTNQGKALYAHGKRVFGERFKEAATAYMVNVCGVSSTKDLSFQQASDFIAYLSNAAPMDDEAIDNFIAIYSSSEEE